VVDDLFQQLRKAQFIEVTGMTAGVYRATLTTQGRARADALASTNQYVGPAAVSLEAYDALVRAQAVAQGGGAPRGGAPRLSRRWCSTTTSLRPARQSPSRRGRPSSLQGPSGTGKTVESPRTSTPRLVRGRGRLSSRNAVELGGRDHRRLSTPGAHHQLSVNLPRQPRPPAVGVLRSGAVRPVAGGELTVEMLDLQFSTLSEGGFYRRRRR
jgi:hypothetical protein